LRGLPWLLPLSSLMFVLSEPYIPRVGGVRVPHS
jgi:hypothetical protein